MKVSGFLIAFLFLSLRAGAEPASIDFHALGEPQQEVGNEPLPESEWENIECRSDGTCVYRHRVTGELRTRNNVNKKPVTQPAPEAAPPQEAVAGLTEEEQQFLNHREIQTLADLKRKVALARKAGKDSFVVQVGNLEGCPPCQQINAAIMGSDIAKDPKVGIFDINYLKLTDPGLKQLLADMKLPAQFSFPNVFVLGIAQDKDWFSKYTSYGRAEASVANLTAGLAKVRTKSQ